MAELRTERMRLRPVTRDDVGVLTDLDRAPGVLRYLARTPPTREETAARIEDDLAEAHPAYGRWLAFEDGAFVGWFSLRTDERGPGSPELGYRLHPDAWGRGLATEGGRALVAHASAHGAHEVRAETMAVNTSSRRVLEKLGLRHVDTLHRTFDDPLPGTEHGEVCYRLRLTDR